MTKRRKYGLTGGDGWWTYRDPLRPQRAAVIHLFCGGYEPLTPDEYHVWLRKKGTKLRKYRVRGGMFDAIVKAVEIVHAPPGKPLPLLP